MIIVDTALKKLAHEGKPLKVAIVGAGFIGRGCALSILKYLPGMDCVAISNRTLSKAETSYKEAGITQIERVETVSALETAIASGTYAVTDDALLLCQAEGIDVVMETTGDVELGAHVVLKSIAHKSTLSLPTLSLTRRWVRC